MTSPRWVKMPSAPGISASGDGRYRVRVTDPRTGERVQRVTHSLADAREVRRQVMAGEPDAGRARRGLAGPTVREYGAVWLSAFTHAPGTAAGRRADLERWVYPVIGEHRVADVSHTDAMLYRKGLVSSGLAVSTQAKIDSLARSLFAAVVADELRTRSPFDKVPRIDTEGGGALLRQGEHVPTMCEARVVVRAFDEARRGARARGALTATLVGTGLRIGEALALDVDALDRLERPEWITVRHQVQRGKLEDGGPRVTYLKAPKTRSSERRVPVPTFLADILDEHRTRNEPREVTLPWVNEAGEVEGERTLSVLFPSPRGLVWDASSFTRDVSDAFDRVLDVEARVGAHSLRKLYTTVLHDGSVPLKAIDTVTGHVPDKGHTIRTYTTVTPGALEAVRETIETAWIKAANE